MLKAKRRVTGASPALARADARAEVGAARVSRFGGPTAILCATALMATQDVLVKALSSGLSLWQFFFLRSLLILPVLSLLIGWNGACRLRAALDRWVLLRSALIVAMYVFFYAALPVLELTVVSAVYYTGPLLIVLFSSVLLRERATVSHAVAVIVAFCGVMIVLRPAGEDFSRAALIPFASALCYALAMTTTRGKVRAVDPWALTFSLNIAFASAGALGICLTACIGAPDVYPFLLTAWSPLDTRSGGAVVLLAALSIGIHLLLARAYQRGPTTVVASLDFSYLGFAAVGAFLFFGTVPALPTVLGTCLISATGLWGVLHSARR